MGLKIRGIYATALTCFFLEHNFSIVSPSRPIKARFKGYDHLDVPEPVEVEIKDRRDSQGVVLKGEPFEVGLVVKLLKDNFFDAICREKEGVAETEVDIELPYQSKKALDQWRNKVLPTVPLHHRLRVFAPRFLDLMEQKQLSRHPGQRKRFARDMERNLIWGFLKRGREVAIEHVKLDGRVLSLSEGKIIDASYKDKRLVLERSKFKGRYTYDGLTVPKEEGDYAITEVGEGDWYYRHSYYRSDGSLIGQYYNINTQVEVYPDRIRYVDLEVDVVKWPDGNSEIVEKELLERQLEKGSLTQDLGEKATSVAGDVKAKLSGM